MVEEIIFLIVFISQFKFTVIRGLFKLPKSEMQALNFCAIYSKIEFKIVINAHREVSEVSYNFFFTKCNIKICS